MTQAFAFILCVVVFFLLMVAINLRGKHDSNPKH